MTEVARGLVVMALDLRRDGRKFYSWPLWLALALGWVTVFAWLRPTQPATLSGMGNKYQPNCGDALQLGSRG